MKIKIDSDEVKRILEMHSKLKKKPILEQETPNTDKDVTSNVSGDDAISNSTSKVDSSKVTPELTKQQKDVKTIKDAEAARCLTNGEIRYKKNTKDPVYVVTTLKSAKLVYFYPDMTYRFADGSKSGGWKCDNLQDFLREIAQNNYMRKEDINVSESELSQLYQKHPNYELFKPKYKNQKVAGFTVDQQAFIDQWKKKKNAKGEYENTEYVETLTPQQRASGTYQAVRVNGTEQLFPNGGLIMYKPAAGLQVKKECRVNIKKYYNYWKTKREDIPQNEFDKLKSQVQACANQNEGKWGGIFSDVDNQIKTLRGGTGGPLSDSKWRIR